MTDESGDWFERALAEEEDEEDKEGNEVGGEEDEPRDDPGSGADPDDHEGDETAVGRADGTGRPDKRGTIDVDGSGETDSADSEPPFTAGENSIEAGIGSGGGVNEELAERTEPDDGDSLFDEDFGAAFESAPDVPTDDEQRGADPSGFSDLDFGLAGADEPDFEEEPDTDLPRIDLGVDGLDGMIQGGIPERSLVVAIGSAGTGKTTLGLQFLAHGLEQGERGVFIALEESRERVINSATEKGFAFDKHVADGRLAIVDLDPVELAHSLNSIGNELPALIEEFGASRLVLDSVSLLEMMYDDQSNRRNEIYGFASSLKDAGVTSLLTSEASEDNPYASRHGIVEYLTDGVFVLQYVRPDDFRETRLAIEIQKIRDANHSREKKPYEITADGLSVYQQGNLF
ncbi:KaiC domain-containing protein [Natrarchaeobius chitinivorans]|uniref:KaiC domain-containing protein n=1 Tax=Natrarchaeobius chitinivorans TaxID=1679083 RepID=UPI001FB2E9D9|nr:KaiC domain-containing protein [Natrarchaeobius chitinivorans]